MARRKEEFHMQWNTIYPPLLGGALIGGAVTLMLLFNGRVTGISGIIASSISKPSPEGLWRWFLVAGLLVGGMIMNFAEPGLFANVSGRDTSLVLLAGLLVGYGTVMGSGCTSGHGVCGVSRLSIRSIIATVTFMFFGFLTVQLVNFFTGSVQ
jgi:uncharacterized membrane protein YedE/YeeE